MDRKPTLPDIFPQAMRIDGRIPATGLYDLAYWHQIDAGYRLPCFIARAVAAEAQPHLLP
jgi:hypothetical protein